MWTLEDEVARLRKKLTVIRLVTGTVKGGVVIPDAELPEGARVIVQAELSPVSQSGTPRGELKEELCKVTHVSDAFGGVVESGLDTHGGGAVTVPTSGGMNA